MDISLPIAPNFGVREACIRRSVYQAESEHPICIFGTGNFVDVPPLVLSEVDLSPRR